MNYKLIIKIFHSRKRKGDTKSSAVADKRVKIEADVFCDICYENFDTSKLRHAHYAKKHLVQTSAYGCSSCNEQHADEEEHRLHHENVHKKKRIVYTCPMCSAKINGTLPKFNTHVESCVCPFYNTVDVVDNIVCAKCKCEFETKNLFDWHGCFIANKRPCPKCKRVFVKKSTLWRHIFACNAVADIKSELDVTSHMVHIPNTNISADSKRPKKATALPIKIRMKVNTGSSASKKMTVGRPRNVPLVSFKAEPETILEPLAELEKVLESTESMTDSLVSPGGSNGNEGSELFGFDASDIHFGDDGDTDDEQSALNIADGIASSLLPCSVNLETIDFTDFSSITINNMDTFGEEEEGPFDEATHHGDHFEDDDEQVTDEAIVPYQPNSELETANVVPQPSTSRASESRQPLTMRIKREVMHPDYGDVVFNPILARNIKREKSLPVQRTNARKSTAKPTYTIVHSDANSTLEQQPFDPVLARNIKREKGTANQLDNTSKLTSNVQNTSGTLFDPVLARNIKREIASDTANVTARKSTAKPAYTATTSTPAFDPVLARNIKREQGLPQHQQSNVVTASTSSINPIAGTSNAVSESDNQLFDPILARNIKREKGTEKPQKSTLRPNPLAVASTLADKSTKASKKMYKMTLLAEKIRQERLAALSTEETSNGSISSQNVFTQMHSSITDDNSSSSNSTSLPIISNVLDANNLETLTSDGMENQVLPITEQTSKIAELIPFKPIRISTEFKKTDSTATVFKSPTEVAETIESNVPFTICEVVSLTTIDAVESQPLEPETNETQLEDVECGKNSENIDIANTLDQNDENLDEETNQDGPETDVELELKKNDETNDNDSVAMVENSNQQQINIQKNGNSNIHSNEQQEPEIDYQTKMSADKNTIMASLEAIQQIVTELEKNESRIVAEETSTTENGDSNSSDVTDTNDDANNDVLPMDIVESMCINVSDRISQIEMKIKENESDRILSTDASESNDLPECKDNIRDNEYVASDTMDTHTVEQRFDDVEKIKQNEFAENVDTTQTIQNATNVNSLDGLDDISDDSLG